MVHHFTNSLDHRDWAQSYGFGKSPPINAVKLIGVSFCRDLLRERPIKLLADADWV